MYMGNRISISKVLYVELKTEYYKGYDNDGNIILLDVTVTIDDILNYLENKKKNKYMDKYIWGDMLKLQNTRILPNGNIIYTFSFPIETPYKNKTLWYIKKDLKKRLRTHHFTNDPTIIKKGVYINFSVINVWQ